MNRACLAGLLLLQAAQAQQPTFRARVDQVVVDVVVTDRNDRPITDLTAADFEIVENGRVQTITDFQFVSIPVPARPAGSSEAAAAALVAAPLPDVGTNAPPTPGSRLFVLVIDDLHIIESEIVPVKRIITDFVTALAPDDEVGVVFTGRSDLGINITGDRARLLAAIDRVRDAMGFGLDALHRLPGGFDAEIDGLRKLSSIPLGYARSTAFTLRNVAAALAASRHPRRAILFVSAGSAIDSDPPISSDEFQWSKTMREEMNWAFEAARRADVPIYTLDPRGHTMPEDAVRGGIGTIGGLGVPIPHEDLRKEIARRIRIQQDYLSTIAVNTGGRAFINQSDLGRAVNEIVTENGNYYLLAYSPTPMPRDGRFHEIEVKVRRDGVRVRARNGYVAPSDAPALTDPAGTLAAAMTSGINVSGIGLRAVATPLAPGAKGMRTAVTMQVTYPMLPGSTAPIDDVLHVSITGLDGEAKVKASSEHAFTFKARPIDAGHVTFLVNGAIELPPQPLTLRIGLASRSLGRAGMVQLPVQAPKPSDAKLQMSGVAIGLEDAREPALGGDIISSLLPFQPTATRSFAATDTLRLFARVFWESKDESAELTIGVKGAPSLGMSIPLAAAATGNRREAAFDARLPLRGLQPGDYVLELRARLPGGQTALREIPFQIISR